VLTPAKNFEDHVVWQKAHTLVLAVCRLIPNLPKSETYGLVDQLKRSAISVPANIAEGFKKRSQLEKLRYYNIAQGSLEECRYYLLLIKDLGLGDSPDLQELVHEVKMLLGSCIQK
jgi:four helix bundle protein